LQFDFPLAPARVDLVAWYRDRDRELPWRTLWRRHHDPYHVWVSEIMLQQTVIKAVLPVYARFLAAFPTVRDLAAADEESVREAVRGLGYYRRFRFLHAAAKALVARSGARGKIAWPASLEGWRELPGIGEYTAAAIGSIAFDLPAGVVDGNVERVFCRLLDLREPPNTPELKRAFKVLSDQLAAVGDAPGDYNQALMELGQEVCTPTSPECPACPLAARCLARARSSQALAPQPKTKPDVLDAAMRLVVVRRRGRIALWQRPESDRFLKSAWGFPTTVVIAGATPDAPTLTHGELPPALAGGRPVARIKHGITNHRITASVEVVDVATEAETKALPPGARWLEREAVEAALLANLDRKAWHAFLDFERRARSGQLELF
jgi:A/G-specific adenine glycosylase